MTRLVTLDPRVAHRGIGGHGSCVDCGSIGSGFCAPKKALHPRIWQREKQRFSPAERGDADQAQNHSFRPDRSAE